MKFSKGLTIVIPVYNRAGIVGRTLSSVASQTRLPDEVILVDNNSTDATFDVLSQWASEMSARGVKVRVIKELRPGASRARQTGLESVATDKVMFFDSDDVMRPGHVERVYRMFEDQPECDIAVWPIRVHLEEGSQYVSPILKGRYMDSHQLHTLLSTLRYAVRTDFIMAAGGWDVNARGWDDLELGHRLLLRCPKVFVSHECLIDVYAQGEASITGSDYTHGRGQWEYVIDKMERDTLASDYPDKGHVMRLLAYRRAILGALYRKEGNREAAAEQLSKALSSPYLNPLRRLYLRLAYAVTSRGLRGAARPAPYLL